MELALFLADQLAVSCLAGPSVLRRGGQSARSTPSSQRARKELLARLSRPGKPAKQTPLGCLLATSLLATR